MCIAPAALRLALLRACVRTCTCEHACHVQRVPRTACNVLCNRYPDPYPDVPVPCAHVALVRSLHALYKIYMYIPRTEKAGHSRIGSSRRMDSFYTLYVALMAALALEVQGK